MGKCDSDGFFGCDLEFGLYIYLTTLLTSPIVFLLFFKNGKSNWIELFTICSKFNDTSTDVKLVESDSQAFSILFRIWDNPQFQKSQKMVSHITNKDHHRINHLKVCFSSTMLPRYGRFSFLTCVCLVFYEKSMVSVCRPVCVSRQTLGFQTSQGMCLMQYGATSHIAHTTLSLLQARALAIQIARPSFNQALLGCHR